ncbi:hypothetical protein DAPPUDRAFT_302710 [Daphnia pulex]|uniref:Uncharacterized protein n=1 Tax=Daphnia pulex TaxID=6669 RepID=E9HPA3_DAPPU|nr:hypothetical protein DAPPUDRAFT_302710 [Daphnia pulex]|eukprot:EFX66405.1 hypothetical protein DAPPUDRAFT_302710 [Daphnia pulex]
MANAPVIVIEDNPSNFLEYRLRGRPSVISFEELNLGHSSLRKIAPYALKIRQTALIPTQQFFSYAAVVATIDETSLACIIFDLVNADEIIAYAGHFLTQKNFLFDPVSREPVISDFSLLDSQLYQSHLTLFGTANSNLVPFPDYFIHKVSEPYQELVTKSQDMLMSSLHQQNNVVSMSDESNRVIYLLREPLTTSFYHETALPISNKSVERITQKIQPMGSVKVVYGELGSFHSQSYCQPKATEDATNFNAVDEIDGRTTFYSAYEEPGLMPFYYTSYLLGSLRDRHVVGVIEEDNFFIMATKRVYKRNSPAVPISTESLEGTEVVQKIHLPSTLSLSQVVTMLELRQILRHPFMFPDEIEAITKSFGFDESNKMPAIPSSTFFHQIGPKTMIERIRKTWLIDMLDVHYTQLFQNSVCEYGETPIDSNNPSLFCLDIARLWIKELLRVIHEDKPPKDDRKLSNFFRMTIAEFVQSYLASFGLSPEFAITCHHLGTDGIPSSTFFAVLYVEIRLADQPDGRVATGDVQVHGGRFPRLGLLGSPSPGGWIDKLITSTHPSATALSRHAGLCQEKPEEQEAEETFSARENFLPCDERAAQRKFNGRHGKRHARSTKSDTFMREAHLP